MRSPRRRPPLVPVLLCALAVLAARPSGGSDGDRGAGGAPGAAEVARLYEAAARTTQEYEKGRREAETQRAKAQEYEERLDRERRHKAVLREELGRLARAQYRTGGGLTLTARVILARDPEQLMRSQRVVAREGRAVDRAVTRSRRAEARLTADEARATAAWKALERRNAGLVKLRKDIEAKLETARARMESEADASVSAGSCPGAVRLDQPDGDRGDAPWVAPVRSYDLSASFGSGGTRWADRHTGQDFAVPTGTPVRSVGRGRVVTVTCGGAFGIQIVLQHPEGYYTQYAHLSAVAVDQGDRVEPGQWIGQSGTTGNSTGPHLHFEVRVTPQMGSALDPVPWLARHGVTV
ncbi:peptidoglycan DD-metalloendopeptidase family protein [Streptomyces sp. NPDC052077]|uniref:peptidoglycan DD-metalloendopeptidase family protein n=1 Tax=Streptomyces sp. NPDC052077 TaxID=3154757 RepID=UPI0034493B28